MNRSGVASPRESASRSQKARSTQFEVYCSMFPWFNGVPDDVDSDVNDVAGGVSR